MKNKIVKAYVAADSKASKFWSKYKQADSTLMKKVYKNKAHKKYAERDAYGRLLQASQSSVKNISTHISLSHLFNKTNKMDNTLKITPKKTRTR